MNEQTVFDSFFSHVTNDDLSEAEFMNWLSQQTTINIEMFLYTQSLTYYDHRLSLMRLTLDNRNKKQESKLKVITAIVSWPFAIIAMIISGWAIYLLTKP